MRAELDRLKEALEATDWDKVTSTPIRQIVSLTIQRLVRVIEGRAADCADREGERG